MSKPEIQALTLRIPIEDYELLRAEAFVRDLSINEVVLAAIRDVIVGARRTQLQRMLLEVQTARAERGQPAELPRNPHRRGPKRRIDR